MGLKGVSTKTSPIVNKTQIRALLNVPGRDGTYFSLALYTGLRLNEITSLKWSQLLSSDETVVDVLVIRISKQGIFRNILLKEELKTRLLQEYQEQGCPDKSFYVFRAKRGGRQFNVPLSEKGVNKFIVKPNFEKLGIVCTNNSSHALRKSLARAYYDTHGLAETQALLGHKSSSTTLAYIGVTDEVIAKNLKELTYD